MSVLVFDTETTGLPPRSKAPFHDSQAWSGCRLVELAWSIHTNNSDGTSTKLTENSLLVKPIDFTIPVNATAIHGITNIEAAAHGSLIEVVLQHFLDDIATYNVNTLVAHNIAFDDNVILSEMWRLGLGPPDIEIYERLNRYCTMLSNTKKGRKWPKLCDLYMEVAGQPMVTSHRAMPDVQACAYIYFNAKRTRS